MDAPRTLTLNAFQLKMIAILAMVMDHVGLVFFPSFLPFRVVGRLTAPIMAFFIAEGYTKTRNIMRYMLRLFVFALISMLPYVYVFGQSPFNILFDLLLGLVVIHFSQSLHKEYQKWALVAVAAILAFILQSDGRLGISTLVYLFYRFREDRRKIILSMSLLYFGVLVASAITSIAVGQMAVLGQGSFWLRPLSLLSLLLLFRYHGERGPSLKYFFYAFYPLHLLIIYAVMCFI